MTVDTCAVCGVICQGRQRHTIEYRADGRVRYLLVVCLKHADGATEAVDGYLRSAGGVASGARYA